MGPYDPWADLTDRPHLTLLYRAQRPCGLYDHHTKTITLRDGMTGAQRRCTLAHELVHEERGDVALSEVVLNARQEQIVERISARRLIALSDLLDALRWTSHLGEAAEELYVDLTTLRARIADLTELERAALDQLIQDRAA